jgi:metallo-beta-lactamase family protein
VKGLKRILRDALNLTFKRGGCVLIPSFAFGRTQELLYVLHELYDKGEVDRVPVYVDSPLAVKLTKVFGEHPETYDEGAHETFLERGKNPFFFKEMHLVKSLDESMELMKETKPHIVISASGMCEAGRILHHLRYKIHKAKNTILIVGYMAQHTLGRRILEEGVRYEVTGRMGPPPELKFLGKVYPLNAHVVTLDGFSAHADRNELMHFIKKSNLKIKKIALVHGEEEQSIAFEDRLREQGYPVILPKPGELIKL